MLRLADPPRRTVALAAAARDGHDRLLFARRDAGDRVARDQLIERFLPLARSVARRYERPGEPLDDLVQVASLGLVKAVDRFDAGRGHAFTSFAVPTIAGELKRHIRDRTWTVRPPRRLQEMTLQVESAVGRLSEQGNRAPTVPELAAAVGARDEEVLEALQALRGRTGVSLQAPPDGATAQRPSLQESLGRDDANYERAEDRAVLVGLVGALSPREREALRLRFEHDLTQAQIGVRLGISQMQVSRIIRQSISRLRAVADQRAGRPGSRPAGHTRRPQPRVSARPPRR